MSSVKKAFLNLIGDKIVSQARVVGVDAPADRFRFISLESNDFAKAKWNPGDKIQINAGDWNVRTYTPLALDRETRSVRILAFLHGDSPGARWAANVQLGDSCQVLGPGRSLDFKTQPTPVVFFGDETSFGAASTLNSALNSGLHGVARFVFEVSNARESEKVLEQIGIGVEKVILVQKTPSLSQGSPQHSARVVEQLRYWSKRLNSAHFIFTGNAHSIRAVRHDLKALKERPSAIKNTKVKVYWA